MNHSTLIADNECRALIELRPFQNTDPPGLAEIWRGASDQRGLMQPMTVAVLERHVFSKPYFDPEGLIVAAEGDQLIGFAHAGFGPSEDQSTLSTESGVVLLVMSRAAADGAVASQLLERAEQYLRRKGAARIFGGGCSPLAAFYFGLSGGSEPTGVLESDRATRSLFECHGYEPCKRCRVLQRDIAQFRPVIDRQQMQIRRTTTLETVLDPPTASWWEACLYEPLERVQFRLMPRDGGAPLATVYFWDMETMAGTWGVRATGIVDLVVHSKQRRQGMATFLLGEAIRQLHTQGVALAEVHVDEDNAQAIALFQKLGFEEVDRAVDYRKV